MKYSNAIISSGVCKAYFRKKVPEQISDYACIST